MGIPGLLERRVYQNQLDRVLKNIRNLRPKPAKVGLRETVVKI